ncbi:related to J domain-containing protein 1 [Phialocephala subalpina]|uniref:Related to J domain-containing protein 1 n=1 Tax=Phialocephala subalpina TaxID=576137 RepID=A0A1L7WXR8_9HELO|nr:related to J domain-containing protein 1 [Phialocephala subalpina]
MFKKSGILLSCNNLHSLQTSSTSKTSLHPSSGAQQCRSYAMVSDGHSRHNHGKHRWPEVSSANSVPTPYQIFGQRKGSPYSKKRFYELVKQYHPDRHDLEPSQKGLSYATKLERYRLVVAANNILSDPVKRGAYDCYGAGWNGSPDVVGPRDSSEATTWGTYSGRGWGGGPGGPSQNATWEDWEKWYQRDAKGPQEPRFVSNSAFVALIMIFATLGGIGQATRAGSHGVSFIEQRDALHDSISKDLMRRRKETTTVYGSREERIHSFLKQRDPEGYGVIDPKEGSYRKALPPPEICSSEDIKGRRIDVYQGKSNPKEG